MVGVLVLLAIHIVLPQRSGVLALTQVFEPYIVLTGILAAALALMRRTSWRVAAVALFALVVVGRYGPVVISFPTSSGVNELSVVTWNALAGQADGERVRNGLAAIEADLVGLQELQGEAADMLATDPTLAARYPYRALAPDDSVYGVGLLSRHPIVDFESSADPPYIVAHVEPAGREPISVIVAHPLPSRIRSVLGIPVALDATLRDSAIGEIRDLIDAELALGRQVVVLGDFNVTEREPGYHDLSHGLRDAHLDAGVGLGHTWRLPQARWLPLGMIRIDYVLTSPDLAASSTHTECSENSDHCLLAATLSER